MQIGVEKHVFGSGALEHFEIFVLICVCIQQLLWPINENNLTIFFIFDCVELVFKSQVLLSTLERDFF